jgi:hypothetical protein
MSQTANPQDRQQPGEAAQRPAHLLHMSSFRRETEIWATGSLMAIDLQRLEREFAADAPTGNTQNQYSKSGGARLSSHA